MTLNYNKLWKLLIDKNINKTQLCEMTGISTNAMAKLGKNESVQLDVLVKICEVLNCNIEDIVEIKKKEV
jgi:DNA-binding Xre family transcriptional regulator